MTLIQVLESRHEALTVHEVANLLGVSDKHIYEMTADGTLPAFHVGRSVRLDPQDIADWLRKKRSPAVETRDGRRPARSNVLNRSEHASESRAVYRILRTKIHDLDAAATIDDSSSGQASGKTP